MTDAPRTLRDLYRLIESADPRYLDAPLAFDVKDWRENARGTSQPRKEL